MKPEFSASSRSAATCALMAVVAVTWLCASPPAHAVGSLADITVIDRQTGAVLPVHYHRGDYWVAGRPGAAYAIQVRNRLGERVLAVTSVDGVNVLSGDAAGWAQAGYVFDAHASYPIFGWRKSNSEVAAFEFAAAGESYASRTGRPDQVGVIGVALFKEQRPEPVPQRDYLSRSDSANEMPGARQKSASPLPSPLSPPAPSAASSAGLADSRADSPGLAKREAAAESSASAALPRPPEKLDKLGTAHGQRERSHVSPTSFVRLQSQPNEIIRIRYDSRERLIASGVIREPYRPSPSPDAFPESARASYVPDPPHRY